MPGRFRVIGGSLYDGGVKILPKDLEATLTRNYQAIMANEAQGGLGKSANRLLVPEWQDAYKVYRGLYANTVTPLDTTFQPLFERYPLP